jgi:PAS domain S-box-containing protein
MGGLLIAVLFGFAGVSVYAALQHAWTAWTGTGRPMHPWPMHLWFALLCLAVAGHVVAKAGGYQADSALAVVAWRRWDIGFALVFFAVLPWFTRAYTATRSYWVPLGLTVFLAALLAAHLTLPYGLAFSEIPAFTHQSLPWGERVADLRLHRPPGGFLVALLGVLMALAYSVYAGFRQYRRGERVLARRLLLALAVFTVLLVFNQIVNLGLVDFVYAGEFGFLALVLIMHLALGRELRVSQQYLRALVDHVPAIVFVKDAQSRYLLVNRRFEESFGVSSRALLGRTDEALFLPAEGDRLRANDRQVLDGGRAIECEETVTLGAEPHSFATLKFPILDADGRVCAVCGISTDTTAARQLEREVGTLRSQVWHADRVVRLSILGSSLAHELRQPLAAILANAEAGLHLLARNEPDPAELREILQDIVRDNSRAIAIIDGLRDMLRQGAATRVRVPLADIVAEMLDYMQGELRRRGVLCERSLDPSCQVLVDRIQIGQVIMNLVMNALDAMDDCPAGQKHLSVSVRADAPGQVCAAVRDSGTGLPPDAPQRIFESFFSTKTRGLGMGLALSRSIIEAHGGRIWATANPDRGATVQFVLPLAGGDRP